PTKRIASGARDFVTRAASGTDPLRTTFDSPMHPTAQPKVGPAVAAMHAAMQTLHRTSSMSSPSPAPALIEAFTAFCHATLQDQSAPAPVQFNDDSAPATPKLVRLPTRSATSRPPFVT
ncbi:unnamed protein product, partial [Sphacelaria rigidula]